VSCYRGAHIDISLVVYKQVSMEIFIDIESFWPHLGDGVDSDCNRNEYQEHFLGKSDLYIRLTTLPLSYAVVKKSGNYSIKIVPLISFINVCNDVELYALPFTLRRNILILI